MKRSVILSLFLLLICSASTFSQTKQPKTVRDFFTLLPDKYFVLECCLKSPKSKQKAEYLKRYLNVEDTDNGYMSGYGNAAQEGFEMALFKRPDGTYLIAFYTEGEGGTGNLPWCVFLDYTNGIWTDVSRSVVPEYTPEKYEYDLPRVGTTIGVYKKVEQGDPPKLYELVWDDGKFAIKK